LQRGFTSLQASQHAACGSLSALQHFSFLVSLEAECAILGWSIPLQVAEELTLA
jgi:hypothetical protein